MTCQITQALPGLFQEHHKTLTGFARSNKLSHKSFLAVCDTLLRMRVDLDAVLLSDFVRLVIDYTRHYHGE